MKGDMEGEGEGGMDGQRRGAGKESESKGIEGTKFGYSEHSSIHSPTMKFQRCLGHLFYY